MSSSSFTSLVNQVIETARGGTLLSEECFTQSSKSPHPAFASRRPGTVALALRQLAVFCDLSGEFYLVNKRLEGALRSMKRSWRWSVTGKS